MNKYMYNYTYNHTRTITLHDAMCNDMTHDAAMT